MNNAKLRVALQGPCSLENGAVKASVLSWLEYNRTRAKLGSWAGQPQPNSQISCEDKTGRKKLHRPSCGSWGKHGLKMD